MKVLDNIEVLMLDGCTKSEAERHLRDGAIVINDYEEDCTIYAEEWFGDDEDDMEAFINMIRTKEPLRDFGVVENEGITYYIMYVL